MTHYTLTNMLPKILRGVKVLEKVSRCTNLNFLGAFGNVILASLKSKGTKVAIKAMKKIDII